MKKICCLLFVIGCLFGCSQKEESQTPTNEEKTVKTMTPDEEHKAELAKYKGIESGLYKVGKDIEEGEYCLISDKVSRFNNSFEVRVKEYSEGEEPILDNTKFYCYYLTLKKGEYIEFDGALLFNIKNMPYIKKDITFGMLKVGKDIEFGNYKIIPLRKSEWKNTNFTYYSVLEPSNGKDRNYIVMNDMDFTSDKKVKLKNNQYIDLNNCQLEKVE